MAKKRQKKNKKTPDMIDVRDIIITKCRAPHKPTQVHDDGSAYNRAREKERANKEE